MNPISRITKLTRTIKNQCTDIGKGISTNAPTNATSKLMFTTTTVTNLLLVLMLFVVLFQIDQSSSMINYGYEQLKEGPLWTTFLICLFSFSLFIFSRFALLIRIKILRRKNQSMLAEQYEKDDPILLLTYLMPVIFHFCLLDYNEGSNFFWSYIFCIVYLILFISINYFSSRSNFWITGESEILTYLNDQLKRIEIYAILLLSLLLIILLIYFVNTSESAIYSKGKRSIGILDVILLYLIALRIISLTIFILWKYLIPDYRNNDNQGEDENDSVDERRASLFLFDKMNENIIARYKNRNISLANVVSILGFLFIGYFLFSPTHEKYKQVISYPNKNQFTVLSKENVARETLQDYAKNWLHDKNNNNNNIENIYLLAGQGGGSRAGFWTAAILHQLDDQHDHFYDNLFAVSTVSGSSLGAGIFLNHKKNEKILPAIKDSFYRDKLTNFFNTDFVTASVLRLLFINPLQKTFGLVNLDNRNSHLIKEENNSFIESFYQGIVDTTKFFTHMTPFETIKSGSSDSINHPLFFINSYNINKRTKSVISPVDLGDYEHEDLLAILPKDSSLLSIGEAINLSQMFPILSASARVDTSLFYDGGVYDNSGLSTIRDIYSVLKRERDKHAPKRKIIIIYCENSGKLNIPSNCCEANKKKNSADNDLTSLIKAISGSIFYANTDRHKKKLSDEAGAVDDLFLEKDFSNEEYDINLNRWLSIDDCDSMWNSISLKIQSDSIKNIFSSKTRQLTPHKYILSVYFNSGQSQLSSHDQSKIKELINSLSPEEIKLTAFSDVDTNPYMSESDLVNNRFKSVEKFILGSTNINGASIISGLHETNVEGTDKLSKQLNRRVDISFTFYTGTKAYIPSPKRK